MQCVTINCHSNSIWTSVNIARCLASGLKRIYDVQETLFFGPLEFYDDRQHNFYEFLKKKNIRCELLIYVYITRVNVNRDFSQWASSLSVRTSTIILIEFFFFFNKYRILCNCKRFYRILLRTHATANVLMSFRNRSRCGN